VRALSYGMVTAARLASFHQHRALCRSSSHAAQRTRGSSVVQDRGQRPPTRT